MADKKLLVLPGDGIGPEVVNEALRVVAWLNDHCGAGIAVSKGLLGGCSIDDHGVPVTEQVVSAAKMSDAVLVGAVGGPDYDTVAFQNRPEQGLLRLRKDLDLYANLRPAICFDALADHSTLKREVVQGLDIMIVRELTSGLYFGEPRGIFTGDDGIRRGVNTQDYTTLEIRRVAHAAFDLARARQGKLCSMEKSNVMESGALWREVVEDVHRAAFPDITLTHMYADNGAMQLVRNPKQFDVIVTDNLFGDILSDEAAMLTGSLGMLPSASLGAPTETGRYRGLYEPVHGSAPDIAGKGIANPIATLLSLAMALRYSLSLPHEALRVERAVEDILEDGVRTQDLLGRSGGPAARTGEVGAAVIAKLEANMAVT